MVILIRSSRPPIRCPRMPTRCPRMPTRCPRMPSRWVRQSHDVSDSTHDWNGSMNSTVTTNTTKFYSKTLSYWLPDRCRSFPDRADFQDVSTMLPRLHEPTMPMPTIFQIVEIGTARSAQCDLGFTCLPGLWLADHSLSLLGARDGKLACIS